MGRVEKGAENGMKDITNIIPFNPCPQAIGLKGDCDGYTLCSDCWKQALEGHRVWLEDISKPENRPNDERSTDKGMFIPKSPKDAELDDFKTNVDKSLNELNRGIMQLETEIEMLWSEVEYLKGKVK